MKLTQKYKSIRQGYQPGKPARVYPCRATAKGYPATPISNNGIRIATLDSPTIGDISLRYVSIEHHLQHLQLTFFRFTPTGKLDVLQYLPTLLVFAHFRKNITQ